MKGDYIRVNNNGEEEVSTSCPFWGVDSCKIKDIKCRYGLTEITVPNDCPLKEAPIKTVQKVELTHEVS